VTNEEIQAWKESAEAVISGMMGDDRCPWCKKNDCIHHQRYRLAARVAELERCLAFFASVIKSGEPWTETCEAEYRKAVPGG